MPITQEASDDTEFIDCIEDGSDFEKDILNAKSMMELKLALEKLSAEEMELVIMLYYSKCSQKAYARKKGLDYYEAGKRKKKVLNKLGKHMKIERG